MTHLDTLLGAVQEDPVWKNEPMLRRLQKAKSKYGDLLYPEAVAHGARGVQVRNPPKGKVLELLEEILATLRGGIHDLLQSELDLEFTRFIR